MAGSPSSGPGLLFLIYEPLKVVFGAVRGDFFLFFYSPPRVAIFKCPVKEPLAAHHLSSLFFLFSGKCTTGSFIRVLRSPATGWGCSLPYLETVKIWQNCPVSHCGLFSQKLG